jgi:hypothetical protein
MEQGMQVFGSIQKRLHRAQTDEFERLYRIVGNHLDLEEYAAVLNLEENAQMVANDFNYDDYDVCPTADPSSLVDQQRAQQAGMVSERARQTPQMYNILEAERRFLEAAGVDWQGALVEKLPAPPPSKEQTDMQYKMEELRRRDEEIRQKWQDLEIRAHTAKIMGRKKEIDSAKSAMQVEKLAADMENNQAQIILDQQNAEADRDIERLGIIADTAKAEAANKTKLMQEAMKARTKPANGGAE